MDLSDWPSLRPLLFVCALLIAPAMVFWDGWSYVQLTNQGVTTSAVVTGKTKHYSRRSHTYSVEYRFRDAAGGRRSGIGDDRQDGAAHGVLHDHGEL